MKLTNFCSPTQCSFSTVRIGVWFIPVGSDFLVNARFFRYGFSCGRNAHQAGANGTTPAFYGRGFSYFYTKWKHTLVLDQPLDGWRGGQSQGHGAMDGVEEDD